MCEILLILLEDTGKLGCIFGSAQPHTRVYLSINHGPQIWNVSQNMSQVKSYLLRAYCEPGYVEALGVDRAAGGGRGGRLMKGRG